MGLFAGHGLADSPHLMPRLTYLFMPDLNDSTVDSYASFHADLRATLLGAWCIFLVAPCAWRATSAASYTWGAAIYFYFGSLSMMFAPTTSVCSSYLFLLGAGFVVSHAESTDAQAWLWKFLVMSILAPYYLAAGFAKLRYAGWMSILTGSWIQEDLLQSNDQSIFPGFNAWVAHTPLVAALFSYGCMLVEFAGPLLILSIDVGKPCSKVMRWTITIWSSLVLGFLLGAYVFFSPNFIRQVPLTIMILHGLWCSEESQRPEAQGAPASVYHCRVILAMLLLSSWFAVEMWSDLAHLTGATPQLSKHDPAWPIGEFGMFVHPSETSNYVRSLSLEAVVYFGLCVKKSQDIWSAKSDGQI